ncbi:MAG TPA: pyridoxal-dependent decarboxylase [Pyrinomonadaceae bacterium]|nr:pyridoxal-dependent decarboxylase [Pyrinomonadaceae bacterium]
MTERDTSQRKSSLDVSPEAFAQISSGAVSLVQEYFAHIAERPVRAPNHAGKTLAQIETELGNEGVPLEKLFDECRTVLDLSRHNGHPRFFGYVASPATPIGAFSDLIASALNANITCWRSGPAGTEIERMVVQWLGSLIRYDDNAQGLLTSGGSMANMIALLIAARRTTGVSTASTGLWQSGPPLTIYASSEIHMSIPKAADILGLGRDHVRTVECDAELRLDPAHLRQLIEQDLRDGFRPSCVVASAGTVATGIVDPLTEIADIAREFKLWFHVDGAYGAPGVLDPGKKDLFAGLERADSVSLDPHKWLYVPVDAGCLLFRDEAAARAAFSTDDADYIKVHGHIDDEAFAFWDYGVELSRRFRALKVWLTLRYYGRRRIAAAISDDIALAHYLTEIVAAADDLELLAPAELSICCFRYVPPHLKTQLAGDTDLTALNKHLDQLNEHIMSLVQTGGLAYLSNANVKGRFALRVCITNFRTTKEDIERTVEIVREAGRKLSSE